MVLNRIQSMRLIMSRYRLINIDRPRRTCVLDTLAKHLRKDLAGDRGSSMAAVSCVLDQHGDRDLRLVVGCKPDKPRAIQPLCLAVHGLVVLRRASLARDAQ